MNIDGYVTPEWEQDITGEHMPLFAYGYGLSYAMGAESDVDLDN